MKKLNLHNFILLTGIILCSMVNGLGQGNPPPPENRFVEQRPAKLLETLGLSKDQVRQIRQLNQSSQLQRKTADRNLAESRRALDEAVYADEVDETLVQERLRAFQNAQAEVAKNRIFMEMSIRKLLTREQLVRFRQLRQRAMQNQGNPDMPPQDRPLQQQRQMRRNPNRPPL